MPAVTEVETLAEDEVDLTIKQTQEVAVEESVDLSKSLVVEEATMDVSHVTEVAVEESVDLTQKEQTEGKLNELWRVLSDRERYQM